MSEEHTATERFALFRRGWRCGAGDHAISEPLQDNLDFMSGYRVGRTAYKAAVDLAWRAYGMPPRSIVRE